MEVNQENINKVAEVLRMGKFNDALLKVQDISKLAEQLIVENPGLTAEEIGQLYEQQQMEMENKAPQIEDDQDRE